MFSKKLIYVLNDNKLKLFYNKNCFNYYLINRLIFTSNHFNNKNDISIKNSRISSQSMDLKTRKVMTKYIRHCLPLSPNARIDWNQMKEYLKLEFNLKSNEFERTVIPIVSHSDRTHVNTLLSLDNYLRQTIDGQTISGQSDPLLLCYHFLLINKIIEKCVHFSDNDLKNLSQKLLNQILISSNDDLESGVITRIVVIIRDCLLSLANSSPLNCVFALNLWSNVLKLFKDNNNWRQFVLKQDLITSQLFDLALQKSLRSEAIELAKLSHKLIGFTLFDSNVELWLQTLLRLNSSEENKKMFETLRITDSKVDIKLINELKLILDRMDYETYIESDSQNCLKCHINLTTVEPLSDQQLQPLKQTILEQSMANQTIGLYKELENFMSNQTFDIIVDLSSVEEKNANLTNLLNELSEKYEKILIISKQIECLSFINKKSNKIKSFSVPNHMNDSNVVLFASLSNCKTYLVTNNLFLDYVLNLNDLKTNLFKVWRSSRQIRLSNKLELEFPSSIGSSAKVDSNSVHVPLKLRNNNTNKINYTEQIVWLCAHFK